MSETNEIITINSRKFDGEIHRSWKAELIRRKNSLLELVGIFEFEVNHPHLGFIRRATISYEYYWLDRWYNVFRFHEPDGELRNFYCNLNMPPMLNNGVLDYIDLEIDVLVWKDFSFEILDMDEFEEKAAKFNFPADLKIKTEKSLDELLKMIKIRQFPFDFK